MASLGDLIVRIGASVEPFKQGMDEMNGHLETMNGKLESFASGVQGTFAALVTALPFAAIGSEVFHLGEQFEQASFTIQRATGAAGTALEGLEASFDAVYTKSGASAQAISQVMGELATRTGLTGEALESLTLSNLRFAKVTGTDVQQNLTTSVRLFNEWGVSINDQAAKLDVLYKAYQTSGIAVGQLSQTMLSSGAVLKGLGYDFNSAVALVSNLEAKTGDLDRVMATLNKGLQTLSSSGLKDPQAALQTLIDKIRDGKMSTDDLNTATEVFGKRGINFLVDAAKQGAFQIDDLKQKLDGSKGSVDDMASRTKSLGDKWGVFQHALEEAVKPLAGPLIQALSSAADGLKVIAPYIQSVAEWFSTLPGWVQTAVVALTAVGVAAPIVAAGIGLIVEGFTALAIPSLLSGIMSIPGILATAGTAFMSFATTAIPAAISAAAEFATVTIPAAISSLVTLATSAIPSATVALAALGAAAGVVAAAFIGWELGSWAYKNIPAVKALGDALADIILKIPGIQAFIDKTSGLTAANDQLAASTQKLSNFLKEHGVVVERGNKSLDEWAAAVTKAGQQYVAAHGPIQQLDSDTKKLDETHKSSTVTMGQITAALDKHKDSTNYLAKAKQDLEAAESALAAAYKTIYEPAITDVATAEANLAFARQNVIAAADNVKAAEERLAAIVANRPKDTTALKQAEADLETARKSLKTTTDEYQQAEKDLAAAQNEAKQAKADITAAEKAYAEAVANLTIPALKSYDQAMSDVAKAQDDVRSAADKLKEDEQSLANLLNTEGIKSAKDLQAARDAVKTSTENLKTAVGNLKTAEKDLKDSTDVQARANDEWTRAEKDLEGFIRSKSIPTLKSFEQALDDVRQAKADCEKAADDLRRAEDELKRAQSTGNLNDVKRATDNLKTARQDLQLKTDKLKTTEADVERQFGTSRRSLDDVTTSTNSAKRASENLEAAMSSLGLTSVSKLNQIAAEAAKAYNSIAANQAALPKEKDDALIRMLEAERAAMLAAGTDLPADQLALLNTLKAQEDYFNLQHTTLTQNWAGAWVSAIKDVNSAITNDLSKGISDVITGAGNIGDAFKKMGTDIVDVIVKHVVAEAIKPLLSMLDDVLAKIGSIIMNTLGLGGGGGGVLGTTVGAAGGAAGTIGGAAGNAGGSAGGAAGTVIGNTLGSTLGGVIGGVASAVTGVIGIVQNMHQETSLNAIEHNTRYSMMYLGERADGGILGVLFKIDEEIAWGSTNKFVMAIKDKFLYWADAAMSNLDEIKNTLWQIRDGSAPAKKSDAADAVTSSKVEDLLSRVIDSIGDSTDKLLGSLSSIADRLSKIVTLSASAISTGTAPKTDTTPAAPTEPGTWLDTVVKTINGAKDEIVAAIHGLTPTAGVPQQQVDVGQAAFPWTLPWIQPVQPTAKTETTDTATTKDLLDALKVMTAQARDGVNKIVDFLSQKLVTEVQGIAQMVNGISQVLDRMEKFLTNTANAFYVLAEKANDSLANIATILADLPKAMVAANTPVVAMPRSGDMQTGRANMEVNIINPTVLDNRTVDNLARRVVDSVRSGGGRV